MMTNTIKLSILGSLAILVLLIFCFATISLDAENVESRVELRRKRQSNAGKNMVCIYDSYAARRPERGRLLPEDIDPKLCTHLMYNFAVLNKDGEVSPAVPRLDLEENGGQGLMKRLTDLKRNAPTLKVLLSVSDGSDKFGPMAANSQSREKFIMSAIKMMDRYNFDGINIAWRHPNDPRGQPDDKHNLVKLVRELKLELEPLNYLLCLSTSSSKRRTDTGYDMLELSKHVNFLNVQTIDFNGPWDKKTGMHMPLYGSFKHDHSDDESKLNIHWSINYILEMGVPAEKILMGLTTYGRPFKLEKASENGINAPTDGAPINPGPYTNNVNLRAYKEICEAFKDEPYSWTIERDPDYKHPYAYKGTTWISYDDTESISQKAAYVLIKGLGGAVISYLDTDDFNGSCHNRNFPLINAVKKVFSNAD